MSGAVQPVVKWTEASLVAALRTRYPTNEWALVTQVRDGAGWDRRTFDAIAIGLWASRGHPVHGFECKVSKGDWKRELAQPEKADPLVAFCHYWWIVTPKGIVDPWLLPEGWGLLEVHDRGAVHTVREAKRRDAKLPTAGFVAQLAKRLLAERPARAELDAAHDAGFKAGRQEGETFAAIAKAHAERLEEQIATFEEASGVRIRETWRHGDIGAAVRRVLAGERGRSQATPAIQQARRAAISFLDRTHDFASPEDLGYRLPDEPAPVSDVIAGILPSRDWGEA